MIKLLVAKRFCFSGSGNFRIKFSCSENENVVCIPQKQGVFPPQNKTGFLFEEMRKKIAPEIS